MFEPQQKIRHHSAPASVSTNVITILQPQLLETMHHDSPVSLIQIPQQFTLHNSPTTIVSADVAFTSLSHDSSPTASAAAHFVSPVIDESGQCLLASEKSRSIYWPTLTAPVHRLSIPQQWLCKWFWCLWFIYSPCVTVILPKILNHCKTYQHFEMWLCHRLDISNWPIKVDYLEYSGTHTHTGIKFSSFIQAAFPQFQFVHLPWL